MASASKTALASCCTLLGLATWLLPVRNLAAQGVPGERLFDRTRVHDFYFTIPGANWWTRLQATRSSGQDIEAKLEFEGRMYSVVGLHIKGVTSAMASSQKPPLNVQFDGFVPGMRLDGLKSVNLNNGYTDPTFTREVLTYDLFRRYMPAPETSYIRVHLNGTYWGLYIGVEQINKDLLRKYYRDEDGVRFKGDPVNLSRPWQLPVFAWRGPLPQTYFNDYEIKTPDLPHSWPTLVTAIDKLNNTPAAAFERTVERYFDVDEVLWYLAANNVVVNTDSYITHGHNFYIYFDPDDGRVSLIPWDCNMSFAAHFGNADYRYDPLQFATNPARPLMRNLMAVPRYREIYLAHYRTVLNESFDWVGNIETQNARYQSMIRASVQADPHPLYSYADFDRNVTQNVSFMWGLEPLVRQRRQWLLARADIAAPAPAITRVTTSPARPQAGTSVWVQASVQGAPAVRSVAVRASAAAGPFAESPMFDDGNHRDGAAGDGVFGGSFPVTRPGAVRYYVLAENTAGTVSLYPEHAELETLEVLVANGWPAGVIGINELLADNDQGDVDAFGEHDDWVELYNSGSVAYDLSGRYLSDDLDEPRKWAFPAGTTVAPGGFLRVWCDGETAQGPLHASFALAKAGEEVGLFDTDANGNALLDAVGFGQQKGDRSFGRVPDGGGDLYFVWEPSGAGALPAVVRYDHRRTGSPSDFELRFSGMTSVGRVASFDVTGGPASGSALFLFGAWPGYLDLSAFGWGPLALDPTLLVTVPVVLSPAGATSLRVVVPRAAAGVRLYAQAVAADFSNALTVLLRL